MDGEAGDEAVVMPERVKGADCWLNGFSNSIIISISKENGNTYVDDDNNA